MIQVKIFVFNPFRENTYLLFDESKECAIVDAGCINENEFAELSRFIADNDLKPVLLLNTHLHIDHIVGNQFVSKAYQLQTMTHANEKVFLDENSLKKYSFGMSIGEIPKTFTAIQNGDELHFGNATLLVLETAGHSPGSVSFYSKDDNFVIVGDVLFKGSIGRTDLLGGDYEQLIQSIENQLLTLPDDTIVFSGHGNYTTIGFERTHNPFLNE